MHASSVRRSALIVVLLGVATFTTLLSGCVSSETIGNRPATGVWGYVASSKNAALEIDSAHSNVASVVAKRVLAPVDGFVLATASGEGTGPAMQVGLIPVKRGESADVLIPIMGARSGAVTLTLYVDKGTKGRLDSDPMDLASSEDRPIFVDGAPVSVTVRVSESAAPMGTGAALVDAFDQRASKSLSVTHVVAPGPSWLVVYADDKGLPGKVLGKRSLDSTDAIGVVVPLGSKPRKGGVFVRLHADTGNVGTFEYQSSASATSAGPDQPYIVGGGDVVKRIKLR